MPACETCGNWPQPALAVDALVVHDGKILLITRKDEPWKGLLAFPGGFVDKGEDPEKAVLRELREETGIIGTVKNLVCIRGKPSRDPRGHVISIIYQVEGVGLPQAGDDAVKAEWIELDSITQMAGDHLSILKDFQQL